MTTLNRFQIPSKTVVGAFFTLLLCFAAPAMRATEGSDNEAGDGAGVGSEKGASPNATISSVSGLQIDNHRMNLMFGVPLTPTFNVGGGISYGVTARYSSNIFSYFVENGTGTYPRQVPYIPTLHSPFGVGFEFGFGTIFLDPRGDTNGTVYTDFRKSWVYQSPDGARHQLYMMAKPWATDITHYDVDGAVSGEPMGAHVRGDAYIKSNDSEATWSEYINENTTFITADGSLIKAKYHAQSNETSPPTPAWWELFYPDGRHVIFNNKYIPTDKSLQDSYYQKCASGGVNLNTALPAEMIGWYPTRVENAKAVGFDLHYEDSGYPYLVTRISDDTDRDGSSTGEDINFTIGTSGASAGRYTAITYPIPSVAGGATATVTLSYSSNTHAKYRSPSGVALTSSSTITGVDSSLYSDATIVRLDSVTLAGGYIEEFFYYDEGTSDVSPNNNSRASGRISKIVIPSGGIHEFNYKKYDLEVYTSYNAEDDGNVGIYQHTLKLKSDSTSAADKMVWSYAHEPVLAGSGDSSYDLHLTTVTDPAGNDTRYKFDGRPHYSGTLIETDFYQGSVSSGTLKKKVENTWKNINITSAGYRGPTLPQIIETKTSFYDDMNGSNPNTLIEENLGWDYWEHFTIKRVSGTLVSRARQTVTTWSVDRTKVGWSTEAYYTTGSGISVNARRKHLSSGCGQTFYTDGGRPTMTTLAHPTVSSCSYLSDLMDNWHLSLPLAVEVQDETYPGSGTFATKSRVETRYDAVTGLPLRTVARLDPSGSADDKCTATLDASTGDIVTDFYYDDRGNLALKKVYGGDDASVFRTYTGTGDKPGQSSAPSITATIGPTYETLGSDPDESIYSNSGDYFGFNRWSRNFTGSGVGIDTDGTYEAANHQFLNGWSDSADIDAISGAVKFSHSSNDIQTKRTFDSIGRPSTSQSLGDGGTGHAEEPSTISYIDYTVSSRHYPAAIQTVREMTGDSSQKTETQDYNDPLGRKVISRRQNPDGGYVYQATHYDKIGNVDLVSNWSSSVPSSSWFSASSPVPPNFTDENIAEYISDVGNFTRNCYKTKSVGSNYGMCEAVSGHNPVDVYEFAGRPRRVERVVGGNVISGVDTEYFGFNTKVWTNGVKTGSSSTADTLTIHYSDGYGNLRVVDADSGGSGGGQGADAIYSYDYAGHLIKVNLVAQVGTVGTSTDRYATSDGDNQTRTFSYDPLGRMTEASNQENGVTKYLKFNALGEVLETEDENGRVGGGPGGISYDGTVPTPTNCTSSGGGWLCYAPAIHDSGHVYISGGEVQVQWTATGQLHPSGGSVTVNADDLYYRVTLDSSIVVGWTKGYRNYVNSSFPTSGTHSLTVEVTYEGNTGSSPNSGLIGTMSLTGITTATNGAAYHLVHVYDGRGREIITQKKLLSDSSTTDLRAFEWDGLRTWSNFHPSDCTVYAECGKPSAEYGYQAGFVSMQHAHYYDPADGRNNAMETTMPQLDGWISYPTQFAYDPWGRRYAVLYSKKNGTYEDNWIYNEFQHGGVKEIGKYNTDVYATLSASGDYFPDGSLKHFVQGNSVHFNRTEDGAERVSQIAYGSVASGTGYNDLWDSGTFDYDAAGNITAIGSDSYYYDRMARLKYAKQYRHPHGSQASGYVQLEYDFDIYGNITRRDKTGGSNYLVGTQSNTPELFGHTTARDYTNGTGAPDNKIHDAKFRYDGNGNLVSDGIKDFVYDELKQQIAVYEVSTATSPYDCSSGSTTNAHYKSDCYALGNIIERNAYDADGMRGVRDVYAGSTTTRTTYVRVDGSVIAEFTMSSGTTTHFMRRKHYVYGPLGLLATLTKCVYGCEADEVEDEDTTRYYEYDHLGTIRAITNSSGVLESTFDYEPFGLELIGETESNADTASNTHKFTGHERDKEAGEDYMKARMYTLGTARFPQIDPMFGGAGDPQNWNAYIYVGNSPVGASDPTGMQKLHDQQHADANHQEVAGGGDYTMSTANGSMNQNSATTSNPVSGGVDTGSMAPNDTPGNPSTGSSDTTSHSAGATVVAAANGGVDTGANGETPNPEPAHVEWKEVDEGLDNGSTRDVVTVAGNMKEPDEGDLSYYLPWGGGALFSGSLEGNHNLGNASQAIGGSVGTYKRLFSFNRQDPGGILHGAEGGFITGGSGGDNGGDADSGAVGYYAGAGAGLYLTNARYSEQMRGTSKGFNINIGLGCQVSFGGAISNNNIWSFYIMPPTTGAGIGLSGSIVNYHTDTFGWRW